MSEAAGGPDRPRDAGREAPGPEPDVRGGGSRHGAEQDVRGGGSRPSPEQDLRDGDGRPSPERDVRGGGSRPSPEQDLRDGDGRPSPEREVPGGGGRPGVDLAVPARALAVAAHPDDVEFGCGATLAKWAEAGTVVHHLVCTDGSKGTWDPDADLAALVALRQEEQRAAARALGATGEVVFLGWPDGELASDVRQRWQVAYHIRRLRPDVVLGHDPWQRYRLHPDHRHAGFLTVDGVVAARDPHFFPEQAIAHHRPAALLLFEADEPDHVEVVTEAHVARKLAALEAHRSQFRSTMHVEEGSADGERQLSAFRDRVRGRLAEHGALAGVPYGEAFKVITEL